MLQFVCECDVVKDTGKEEYLRPFIHIGLDWFITEIRHTLLALAIFGLLLRTAIPIRIVFVFIHGRNLVAVWN